MRNNEITQELRSRADRAISAKRLVVDYYRIRRKLSYPLPLTELHHDHSFPLRFRGKTYPWGVWSSWALDERFNVLAWSALHDSNDEAKDLLNRDLHALAQFPKWNQHDQPDLSFGHLARCASLGLTEWRTLLSDKTIDALAAACAKHVDALFCWFDPENIGCHTKREPGEKPNISRANIPIIGSITLSAIAQTIGHQHADELAAHSTAVVDHLLEIRADGYNEAIAYDGYVLDFVAHWLRFQSQDVQQRTIASTAIGQTITQAATIGAPGDPASVAPLCDVEPKEMPFYLSAIAKLLDTATLKGAEPLPAYNRNPAHWLLANICLDWPYADGLVAISKLPEGENQPVDAKTIDGTYCAVVRTGYQAKDIAVVASCPRAKMGHPQADSGSVVIGTQGKWFIDDPGYQQFFDTSEREFTTMHQAHNFPIIGGQLPLNFGKADVDWSFFEEDEYFSSDPQFTIRNHRCYEVPGLERADRLVCLHDRRIEITDRIIANAMPELIWHWHGHPDAAWWVENGQAALQIGNTIMWLACVGHPIEETMIDRLRGSRGQITLRMVEPANADATEHCRKWIFAFQDQPIEAI